MTRRLRPDDAFVQSRQRYGAARDGNACTTAMPAAATCQPGTGTLNVDDGNLHGRHGNFLGRSHTRQRRRAFRGSTGNSHGGNAPSRACLSRPMPRAEGTACTETGTRVSRLCRNGSFSPPSRSLRACAATRPRPCRTQARPVAPIPFSGSGVTVTIPGTTRTSTPPTYLRIALATERVLHLGLHRFDRAVRSNPGTCAGFNLSAGDQLYEVTSRGRRCGASGSSVYIYVSSMLTALRPAWGDQLSPQAYLSTPLRSERKLRLVSKTKGTTIPKGIRVSTSARWVSSSTAIPTVVLISGAKAAVPRNGSSRGLGYGFDGRRGRPVTAAEAGPVRLRSGRESGQCDLDNERGSPDGPILSPRCRAGLVTTSITRQTSIVKGPVREAAPLLFHAVASAGLVRAVRRTFHLTRLLASSGAHRSPTFSRRAGTLPC